MTPHTIQVATFIAIPAAIICGILIATRFLRRKGGGVLPSVKLFVSGLALMALGGVMARSGFAWLTNALTNWTVVMQNELASGRPDPTDTPFLREVGFLFLGTITFTGVLIATAGATVAFKVDASLRKSRQAEKNVEPSH